MDIYFVMAVFTAMALVTTLRFCFTGTLQSDNRLLRLLTHPVWLYSLGLTIPYVLGSLYGGTISPWPPSAYEQFAPRGLWAGINAGLAVLVVDIWVVWASARAAAVFAPPEDRRILKYYYAVNLAVGTFFIVRGVYLAQHGAAMTAGSVG
jgi:hypothetical protein